MTDWLNAEMMYYLTAISIIVFTFLIAFIFNRFMSGFIKKSSAILSTDPTNYQFLRYVITTIIYMVGFSLAIYSVPSLKAIAQSLLAGAGIAAVAIGFASQAALSNVIAGIFIVIFKPFRVNDRVTIKDTITGVVEDITLRHTIIKNLENKRVIIPNSIISSEVIVNADLIESKVCQWIEVGISYDANIERAKQIMFEEVEKHPLFMDNRTDEQKENAVPIVKVRVVELGEFFVKLRAWAWAGDNAKAFELKCDVLESIKKRFDAEGIEIPFPYRTLVFKNSPSSINQ